MHITEGFQACLFYERTEDRPTCLLRQEILVQLTGIALPLCHRPQRTAPVNNKACCYTLWLVKEGRATILEMHTALTALQTIHC